MIMSQRTAMHGVLHAACDGSESVCVAATYRHRTGDVPAHSPPPTGPNLRHTDVPDRLIKRRHRSNLNTGPVVVKEGRKKEILDARQLEVVFFELSAYMYLQV